MTAFGMYARHTQPMMNLELARIIQMEREREVQGELRRRRLLANEGNNVESHDATPLNLRIRHLRRPRRLQRPESGMVSR